MNTPSVVELDRHDARTLRHLLVVVRLMPIPLLCKSLQLGSKKGLKRFQLPQLSPDLMGRGSADVVSFRRSLAKNSILVGKGVQVELWMECCFSWFV